MEGFGQGAKFLGVDLARAVLMSDLPAAPAAAWTETRTVNRPARHAAVDFIAQLRFEHFQFAGQIDGDLGLLAVDRADLHRHFASALRALAASVAGHGFHSSPSMYAKSGADWQCHSVTVCIPASRT
jgi:hypothetical protein